MTGSCSAYESPRPSAQGTLTGAAGGASSRCESRTSAGPNDAWAQAHSSDRLACSVAPAAGGDKTGDATEGRGDCVCFASRSPMESMLAACFLGVGTSLRLSASCSPPVDATTGSQRFAEVATTSRLSSSSEKIMPSPTSVGSYDLSSDLTSLLFSPARTRRVISFSFSCFHRASSAFFFFLASVASFWVTCRAVPFGPFGRCGRDL